mgnify:FL=1
MIRLIMPTDEFEKITRKHCQHFWKIESPNGERSKGICKYCDLIRYFYNHVSKVPNPYHPTLPGNMKKFKDGTTQCYNLRKVPRRSLSD